VASVHIAGVSRKEWQGRYNHHDERYRKQHHEGVQRPVTFPVSHEYNIVGCTRPIVTDGKSLSGCNMYFCIDPCLKPKQSGLPVPVMNRAISENIGFQKGNLSVEKGWDATLTPSTLVFKNMTILRKKVWSELPVKCTKQYQYPTALAIHRPPLGTMSEA
jgi:hypothetical protein